MKSFDLSIDQRFIVFGGCKPLVSTKKTSKASSENPSLDFRKVVNIVTIEPFSYAQKGFEQRNEDKDLESFAQTFEDQGGLATIQIMQVKTDKKKKYYYVIYSTQDAPGLHILSLMLDKAAKFLRRIDFAGLETANPTDDHLVNFVVHQNSVAVHYDSKISMIVFKSKSAK